MALAPVKPKKALKRKTIDAGAPSQKSQTTRKGKKAWRKNVDITDVEAGLEGLREEERVTGGQLQKKKDSELFEIDVVGDEKLRERLARPKKILKSTQILAVRSAIPAVHSRPTRVSTRLTREEKDRMLQKARRARRGALNSLLDPTESGSAVIEPRVTGTYNVWDEMGSDDEKVLKIVKTDEAREYILPLVQTPKIKPPKTSQPSKEIDLPAINTPHPGTSYNPSVDSHQDLLRAAHEIEVERERTSHKYDGVKAAVEAARRTRLDEAEELLGGMKVDTGDVVEEEEDVTMEEGAEDLEALSAKKLPQRKTKSQKLKAARVLAEKRLQAARSHQKRVAVSLHAIKSLSRSADAERQKRDRVIAENELATSLARKESRAGKRLGKHFVNAGEVDVQLGDELSESLRALKPEGNLFKDRFLSLQHRALVEPRVPVMPTRRKVHYKDYEKHPWKRFE